MKTQYDVMDVNVDSLAVALYLWKVPSKSWHQLDEIDQTFWLGSAQAILEFCKGNSDAFHQLTTTQSAPSVGSVPTVEPSMEALIEWACNVETTDLDKEADAFAYRGDRPVFVPTSAIKGFYVGWKSALLTSRTEGK